MGHFGKRADPHRLVRPGGAGAGAQLLRPGRAADRATRRRSRIRSTCSLPGWALYPMVALATAATVIASQATISGAYSMTQQAIQLGYLPRMNIRAHLGADDRADLRSGGQLDRCCVVVVAAVIGFGSSTRLAGAYGVAVTGTMLVDDAAHVLRDPLRLALSAVAVPRSRPASSCSSTWRSSAPRCSRSLDGGWFPLALGACVFTVMTTWRRGREILFERLQQRRRCRSRPFLEVAVRSIRRSACRAPRCSSPPRPMPRRTRCCTTSSTTRCCTSASCSSPSSSRDVPWVPFEERVSCEPLGHGCWRVRVRYGFMDRPDVPQALELCGAARPRHST